MSAAEIIEQIKKLPPEEVRVVQDYLAKRQEGVSAHSVEYISPKEVENSANVMFERYSEMFKKLAQ